VRSDLTVLFLPFVVKKLIIKSTTR